MCSVLFADLVGFTPLSESRDPEEVRELLSRYFETARTVITRYGGVVEKFIGDAVMAVWGTPVAAEGDAERTVRAGLDLVAALAALGAEVGADGLALRAGVVTGEVAATLGAIGEGMVAGDAVNTAARVQSAAHPGTVWVDSATQRLASGVIGFADAGSHALKGKAEPVQLWQATRVLSTAGGTQRVDGLEAPMLGRDAEDRTLRELFHATAERRTPRLVLVSGPAGTGKSRLGWELRKYIDGVAEVVWWHSGRCLSYGDGVAHWALAEAVRQRFEIAEEDASDAATAKLLTGLDTFVADADQRSYTGIRLGRLLGLTHPDDAGEAIGRDDLFAGWRLFFERLTDSGPMILLVEDAQHADDSLIDFLVHVVEWSRQAPIYLVVLARPELAARRPDLGSGRNRTSLTLDALDERSMRELITSLVRDVPEDAVSAIVGQAQGNPLFAVETVRSLVDRDVIMPIDGEYRMVGDVGTLAVPDSLHGLLAARLDALDPQLRALVADAAVLGSTFPPEAITAVSGRPGAEVLAGLAELVRREILDVAADPLSPQRGSYTFSQNMLRQVAYDTLSRRDRRTRHLAVAEHLQHVFADGGEEVMEVVAQHYLDALAALPDDDDAAVRQLAIGCLVRAGERSKRAGAQAQAARSFEQAAGLIDGDEHEAASLYERAQHAYGAAARFEQAIAASNRARELHLATGDRRGAARALAGNARWLHRTRRLDESRAASEEALLDLRAEPDADTVQAIGDLGGTAIFRGDADARPLIDEALGLGQALDVGPQLLAQLFGMAGLADSFEQRNEEATTKLAHAVELADRAGDLQEKGRSLNNLACVQLITDAAASQATAHSAMDLSRRTGEAFVLAVAACSFGEAALYSGEWSIGLAELRVVEDEIGAEVQDLALTLAVMLALVGDLDGARARAELPVMRASVDIQDAIYLAWVDSSIAAAAGDPAAVLQRLQPIFTDDTDVDLGSGATMWCWPLAVRSAFDIDDLAEARRLVEVVAARPVGHLAAVLRSNLALARARLAVADGEPDDAVAGAFDAAVTALRAAASPYHLAHGLLDHAEYEATQGRDASALRAEAAAIEERLGAVDIGRRMAALPV